MSTLATRYNVLAVFSGPSPSTGYQYQTGFNGVMTGANSGSSLISSLERMQTVTDGFSVDRQLVNVLGRLSYLDQVILNQPQCPVTLNWLSADVSNELRLGMSVSGENSAIASILDGTRNERNLFIAVAPAGTDAIGYTGQMSVFQLNNSYFGSYSAEASVGGFASASATFQGLNWSTSTGSINQSLNAVNPVNGQIVGGVNYTLPVATTGVVGAVSALRYGDITMSLSGVQGLVISDLHIQSYNLSFDTNLQDLLQLGSRFAYAKVPQFPINLNCSVTANYGDLTTGSLSNLLCNDPLFNLQINLYQPGCGSSGPLAIRYDLLGVKLQGQDMGAQDVGSNAGTVTLNYQGAIGSSNDTNVNFRITGFSG